MAEGGGERERERERERKREIEMREKGNEGAIRGGYE